MPDEIIQVLLVEDEQAHIRLIQRALETHPIQLLTATTLQEARAALAQKPHIIFLDYLLPDGRGLDLLEQDAPPCPVIVLTSHGNETIAVEALKAGALDYIVKSVETLADMEHIIRRALREWQLIEKSRLAEAALHDRERRFTTLLESASESIVIIDQSGQIVLVNSQTEAYFGYTRHEILGQSVEILIPEGLRQQHVQHRQSYLNKPAARVMGHQMELWARHKNGTLFPVEVRLSYSREQDNFFVMAYIIDITNRKQAEQIWIEKERLQIALEKEKELSRLKNHFLSMTSHEFRNPLASIILSISLLLRHPERFSPVELQHRLQNILEQAERLEQMLDDLSLVVRSDRGFLEFEPELVNLVTFCQNSLNDFSSTDYQINFSYQGALDNLFLDTNLLHHILSNLLSNAIKYSPVDGVIELSLLREPNAVQIMITDQGIGIPPDEIPMLFSSYFRGSNVGRVNGTGLGLKIVNDCVLLHGGSIEVNSELGKGTLFRVRLPLAEKN